MNPRNDLTSKRFGKLSVVKLDHINKARLNFFECKCDCGNTVVVRGVFLKKGIIASCGCPVDKADIEQTPPTPVVEVGQGVRFDPFRHITGFASDDYRGRDVRGRVVYINEPHKWFSVEYGKPKARTSFKFCDIGHGVQVVK
jgi:hypothetical protein